MALSLMESKFRPRPPKPNLKDVILISPKQIPSMERKQVRSNQDGNVKRIVCQFNGQDNEVRQGLVPETGHANSGAVMTTSVELSLSHSPQRGPCSSPQSQLKTHSDAPGQKRDQKRPSPSPRRPLTPGHERGNRSAPDGSEVDVPGCVAVKSRQSSEAPPVFHNGKQCHCMCHLKRPGMKLVWVPLHEDNYVQMDGNEENGENENQRRVVKVEEEVLVSSEVEERADNIPGDQTERVLSSIPSKHTFITTYPIPMTCTQLSAQSRSFQNKIERDEEFRSKAITESEEPPPLTLKMQPSQEPPLQIIPIPSLSGLTSSSELDINRDPPQPPPTSRVIPPPILRSLPPLPLSHHTRQLPYSVLPHPQSPMRPPPNHESNVHSCQPQQSSTDADAGDDLVTDMQEGEVLKEHAESPRRISSDWGPRRQDEPLYQIYQAKAIKEAIRLQSICRNASRTSVDLHVRLGRGGALGTEGPAGVSRGPAEVTLWQDLPVVRDSGLLETLTHEQLQSQESMFEVLTSEASYLHSLRVLTDHFLMSRELGETLLIHDKKTLFSNILHVYEVSERFLSDLLERIDESIMITDVCDIIHQHALHNFSVYIDYIRNQGYQEKAYSSLMQTNRSFSVVMRRLEESPFCRRLPFSSFLLLPFQRITRIKILIQNILKRTQEGTKEECNASRALASVSQIIKDSNTQVGQMKQMEELIHIANNLEFHKLKAVPIVSRTRYLEKCGSLHELSKGGSLFSTRFKLTPIYLFLFNDLLIITYKKSSSERYIVTDHAHRSLVQVTAVETGETGPRFEHSFCLLLLENHRGLVCEHLLKAPSESDMHRWMAAFPTLNNAHREWEEVVYEDFDCPQVQCLEQYTALQADELTLEPADIINVLRKTHEGWYEGIRLSDGEKGWFPAQNVMEITNEHLRRRNLREQYRIAQAAAKVTND